MDGDTLQNVQLCASIEKCLQHVRSLKTLVLNAHNTLAGKSMQDVPLMAVPPHQDMRNVAAESSSLNFEKVRESMEKFAQQMNNEYEKLEAEAKALPSQTPPSLMVNKLNNFLLDCATDPQMNKDTHANIRSVFDWSESTATYINFAYELFKVSYITALTQQRHRKLTLAHQWSVQQNEPSLPQSLAIHQMRADPSNQQAKFVDYFVEYMRQHRTMKIPDQPFEFKIVYSFLERSILSAVIELKYFSIPKNRTSDGQMVCMQKLLLLVNSGIIEYTHFVAPHEDWHYTAMPGIGSKKQIDLSVPSRFELYQKLTIYANMMVNMNMFLPNLKLVQLFMQQLTRMIIFDQTCQRCRKRLRDFTPATDRLVRALTHTYVHMACK